MPRNSKSPILKAGEKIKEGDISAALKYAAEAFRQESSNEEAAGQYLFCLNALGRFDEALAAARTLAEGLYKNETVLSNILCAMLSVKNKKASEGLKLLTKLGLSKAEDWKSKLSSFNYNPSQTSLIFNAAMIFAEAGRLKEGEKLLKAVCGHIVFFISEEESVSAEQIDIFEKFILLIKESKRFPNLKNEESWRELTEIISDNSE